MEMLVEERWQEQMDDLVMPYLAAREKDVSQRGIHTVRWKADEPRAAIVICHGFSEGIYKYYEFIYYALKRGYDCWALELPGHGLSVPTLESDDRVHITDFNDYVDALHQTVDSVDSELPLYLFGHSMGGCVVMRFLETRTSRAEKAVLSSPMFKVNTDPVPEHVAARIAFWLTKLGHGEEYVAGQGPFDPEKKNFEGSGTTSMPRFLFNHNTRVCYREHQKVSSSYSAMQEGIRASKLCRRTLDKVTIPVLLFAAENDTYVNTKAYEKIDRPNIEIVWTKGTRHEVLNSLPEVAGPLYDRMWEFLEN